MSERAVTEKKSIQKVMPWNPGGNFPTIVINNKKCIVGFIEKDIKEALK